jgi:hypothetical protein
VIVLGTLGAPQRRMLGRRRPREVQAAEEAEPVPTTRVTLIRLAELSEEGAEAWLGGLRGDPEALEREAAEAVRELNDVLRAHRAAALDPYVQEVSLERTLVARVGYGEGEQVAEGRFSAAYELPREPRKRRRRAAELEPQERLARILGGHDPMLACEELLVRARADLEAGRVREAALQTRIALEALLAEVDAEDGGEPRQGVEAEREAVAKAANAALDGEPAAEAMAAVERAVERMETTLRRRGLKRSGAI